MPRSRINDWKAKTAIVSAAVIGLLKEFSVNLVANTSPFSKWLERHQYVVNGLIVVLFLIVIVPLFLKTPKGPASELTPEELEHRRRSLAQATQRWARSLLRQPLYRASRLDVVFADMPCSVDTDDLITLCYQEVDREPTPLPPETRLVDLYRVHNNLLVLGAAGSGKSTLLAELALSSLDELALSGFQTVPVFFNLSSWSPHAKSFDEWLIAQFNQPTYGIKSGEAEQLIRSKPLLLLLDGLDEVQSNYRNECVKFINNFRANNGIHHVVVSSQLKVYKTLEIELNLTKAVSIQSLPEATIRRYLSEGGVPLAPLLKIWDGDPTVRELLSTPLMLNIAFTAIQKGTSSQILATGSLEERRDALLANFVERMLQPRKQADHHDDARKGLFGWHDPRDRDHADTEVDTFNQPRTIHWLSWLASTLKKNNKPVFYLEDLQFAWLPTRRQQLLTKAAAAIFFGIVFTLFLSLGFGVVSKIGQSDWLAVILTDVPRVLLISSVVGLLLGTVLTLLELRPVEAPRFRLAKLKSSFSRAMRSGLKIGLIGGVTFGIALMVGVALGGQRQIEVFGWMFLGGFLVFGLLMGLIVGLISWITTEDVEIRKEPNQGTHNSLRSAGIAFLAGACFGLLGAQLGDDKFERLSLGLTYGLFGAFLAGLFGGGAFVIKYWIVRIALWVNGLAPLQYVRFLKSSQQHSFLWQNGGGYVFLHGLLRDYLASINLLDERDASRSTALLLAAGVSSGHPEPWQRFAKANAVLRARRERILVSCLVVAVLLGTATLSSYFRARHRAAVSKMNGGNASFAYGDEFTASLEYNDAYALDSQYAQAQERDAVVRGDDYAKKTDSSHAIAEYKRAIEMDPDDSKAHYQLVKAYESKSDRDSAIAELRNVIKLKPKDASLYNELGDLFAAKYQYQPALDQYRKAVALKHDDVEFHQNLVGMMILTWQYDAALAEANDLLTLKPNDAQILYGYGWLLFLRGRDEASIAAMRRALLLDPAFAQAHNDLGYVLNLRAQYGEAVEELQKAILYNPDLSLAHVNLGFALDQEGQHRSAMIEYTIAQTAYRKTLAADPNDAEAHLGLAFIASRQDHYHLAWLEFLKSTTNPYVLNDSNVQRELSFGLAINKFYDPAISYAEEILKKVPDDPDVLQIVAFSLARKGDLADALDKYDRASRADPTNSVIHLQTAQVLARLGRAQDAQQERSEAYRLNPDLKRYSYRSIF
jgi:tetratricopeptide (TPR) repeat protein